MKPKIVELNIIDNDEIYENSLLGKYYLINPDETKLEELKNMIEGRFDIYGLTDKEIEEKEKFRDDIWGHIHNFIDKNFVTLNIDKTYEIAY